MSDTFIGLDHPKDGRQWEAQCARCGSTLEWIACSACDGEGETAYGELYEQDPLWYLPSDTKPCHQCGGQASFPACISSEGWCKANPLPGREETPSSTPEWYALKENNV